MNTTAGLVGVIPPPPGVTPNFHYPEDRWWRADLIALIICAGLVTFFFIIRCYARFIIAPKIMAEDYTCALAWVTMMILVWTVFMTVHYGEGLHAWEVTREDYREIRKWLYASSVIYCPAALFTKATLLLLISRVFAVKEKVVLGIRIFLVALLICYLPVQGIKMAICVPVNAFWDQTVQGAHCLDQGKVFIADLCLAIVTDFVVLIIPIPLTWSLNMSLRKKVKIVALLGAGGAATAVTILRLVKVIEYLGSNDVTFDFSLLNLATTIEITIGLICACLPSVNILIEKHWAGRLRSVCDPNSPRTISGPKAKESTSPASSTARETSCYPLDFDVEQQMLSGKPIHMGQGEYPSSGIYGGGLSLINSVEGRREGWLIREGKNTAEISGGIQIQRTVEVSLQWSQATGNECRMSDKIWDGTLDDAVSHQPTSHSWQ
ncbi:hypothetical protein F5X99DRAFT_420227 [Biscogniauxia marginata]|nr:hypothetical protein F5X99DRAFT_420227 [Biscogniauxia marginata]